MQASPQDFESILSGIQSIVVSAGLLVGGIWSLALFRVLGQKQRAEAELLALRRQARELGVLEMGIGATQVALADSTRHWVSVLVTIRNVGSRSTVLRYEAPGCLYVTRLVATDGQRVDAIDDDAFLPLRRSGVLPQGSAVSPGESLTEPFLVSVPAPGPYLVTFRAAVETHERNEVARDVAASVEAVWSTERVIVVAPSPPAADGQVIAGAPVTSPQPAR